MKYIVIVPDGMADYPIARIGNKTPLEAARTPNMDFLAQQGAVGLVQTIPDGMSPGSDIGNMAILGYDPKVCRTGRAPLEAANQNIILADDEVAFRCNLVTVADHKMIDYSAGHIPTKEATILIEALNREIVQEGIKFYPGKSYRHLLVVKGNRVKEYMQVKTHPPHDIIDQDIRDFLPGKAPAAEMLLMLMEKSKTIFAQHPVNQVRADLKEHPATMIWLWGQGVRPNLPSFEQKFGVRGGIISAVDLVNGIGRLAGLEVIDVPGITGYYDTNYFGKAQYALESLKKNDFVYVHIEAPDEAGHNGDLDAKISCIERIDREIIGTVLNYFGQYEDARILVLPDHPTPVELRTHTSDPVCFVMYGKDVQPDAAPRLTEALAKEKGLKFASGEALLKKFMTKS
ncbi:MAG TPA: cofactor-independent phosphoglycerate mutase [Candidatus Omnitrophica bacterium]|nr:MAG: cofactor-independent phosphoglycerate mutase [Omnitrophica WOR_2 bacterium GWA2_53_43]HBO98079.1 cofactor-independent phosphoglycerate mutase [Candidatus Omnitrophota bacterium]HCI45073.1 cofactor-independent phosphoglycerate mutase [Candidatus Omnitrophota bacterium]